MPIGLISDTHGQLRPAILEHFQGLDLILHAGDVGDAGILIELGAVAPVLAVYGNTDDLALRRQLKPEIEHRVAGREIVLVHGDRFGTPTPETLQAAWPTADIIVFGHTHRPTLATIGRTLVVNPGAAGPARFPLKPSIAILDPRTSPPAVRFIELS